MALEASDENELSTGGTLVSIGNERKPRYRDATSNQSAKSTMLKKRRTIRR
jgi:hypothetical protein